MSNNTQISEVLEQANDLAGWLSQVTDRNWATYRGSHQIEQCSHPDRTKKIINLIRAVRLETAGKLAFILRCRGPFVGTLEPTSREMLPGEIITISRNEACASYVDGTPFNPGERHKIAAPARLDIEAGDVLFLLVVFTKLTQRD